MQFSACKVLKVRTVKYGLNFDLKAKPAGFVGCYF